MKKLFLILLLLTIPASMTLATLPASGAISASQIQTEFGGANPISLSEYYKNGPYVLSSDSAPNVPSSGAISFGNFYGAAKAIPSWHYWYAAATHGVLTTTSPSTARVYLDGAGTTHTTTMGTSGTVTQVRLTNFKTCIQSGGTAGASLTIQVGTTTALYAGQPSTCTTRTVTSGTLNIPFTSSTVLSLIPYTYYDTDGYSAEVSWTNSFVVEIFY